MKEKFEVLKIVENDAQGTAQCSAYPYNSSDGSCFGACPTWGACHDACCGYSGSDAGSYVDYYSWHYRCGWPCETWFTTECANES